MSVDNDLLCFLCLVNLLVTTPTATTPTVTMFSVTMPHKRALDCSTLNFLQTGLTTTTMRRHCKDKSPNHSIFINVLTIISTKFLY